MDAGDQTQVLWKNSKFFLRHCAPFSPTCTIFKTYFKFFLKNLRSLSYVHECFASMYVCAPYACQVPWRSKEVTGNRVIDGCELTWTMGIKPWSSQSTSALNHCRIFLAHIYIFKKPNNFTRKRSLLHFQF